MHGHVWAVVTWVVLRAHAQVTTVADRGPDWVTPNLARKCDRSDLIYPTSDALDSLHPVGNVPSPLEFVFLCAAILNSSCHSAFSVVKSPRRPPL